jgi:hypothetical protein
MKGFRLAFGALLMAAALAVLSLVAAGRPASAQTSGPPDLAQFGYPRVAGSVTFTPGTAATITAGNQQVILPADFISKTVQFELLEGDPQFFAPLLAGDDQGRPVLATFAFRVTDPATSQRVGRFDKPVQWSITDPSVTSASEVYNTSAANPPVVTKNTTPGTISGTTLAHAFGGAGVGWLVLNAAGAAPSAPTPAPTAPVPAGMPTTGSPTPRADLGLLLAAGALCLAGGWALRRRRATS